MKMQIEELSDNLLDYAVAKASGELDTDIKINKAECKAVVIDKEYKKMFSMRTGKEFSPSVNWEQGGPIIEYCKHINLDVVSTPLSWECTIEIRLGNFTKLKNKSVSSDSKISKNPRSEDATVSGDTLLIAAMRAFCISELGHVIDIPEILLD